MLRKDASLGGFSSLLGYFTLKEKMYLWNKQGNGTSIPVLLFFQSDLKLTLYNSTQGGKPSITAIQ